MAPDELKVLNQFLRHLECVKQPGHVVGGHSLLGSLKGCMQQDYHRDYLTLMPNGRVEEVMPYAAVVALQDDTAVHVRRKGGLSWMG